MENNLEKKLANLTTIGKKVKFRDKMDKNKIALRGEIVDEAPVTLLNKDRHFVQKIKKTGKGNGFVYRTCYYTTDKKKTKIVFGQFASTMPGGDFFKLLRKASKKFLPENQNSKK